MDHGPLGIGPASCARWLRVAAVGESGQDSSDRLREFEEHGSNALRGFRCAFALSLFIWSAGGALLIAGCTTTNKEHSFVEARDDHTLRDVTTKKAHCGDIPLPPLQFDHVPAIRTFITYVPFGEVGALCRAHGIRGPAIYADARSGAAALLSVVTDGGFEMKACSWKNVINMGFVVLPERDGGDISAEWEACALRHEYGHLNGWPATHPDAHYEGDWL